MRAFSWNYFTLTGDVDAYLLYKDTHQDYNFRDVEDEIIDEEEPQDLGNYT
jgi:hypothetical protein